MKSDITNATISTGIVANGGEFIVGKAATKKAERTTKSVRTVWMPIVKDNKTGKYMAILSDNSTDRDDEEISKNVLANWSADTKSLPALTDHKASIDNLVGKWINKQLLETESGATALMAECDFYSEKASPIAQRVKAILDEGGEVGVSIGAIVNKMSKTGKLTSPREMWGSTLDATDIWQWDDAELLEASFVAVPSNRNAFAFAAKQFNIDIHSQGPASSQAEKEAPSMADTEKEMAELKAKLEATEKDLAASEKKNKELEMEFERAKQTPPADPAPEANDAKGAEYGFGEVLAMQKGIDPSKVK